MGFISGNILVICYNSPMRPLLIAHRGDTVHFPENTLEAFQSAIDKGADGFECDVQLDDQGRLIVVHDYLYDRGKKYPLFADVLQQFSQTCFMEIELKAYEAGIVEELKNVVAQHTPKRFELTTSEIPLISVMRTAFSKADIGLIFNSYLFEEWMTSELIMRKVVGYMKLTGANVAHLTPENLSLPMVEALRESGSKVHAADVRVEQYQAMCDLRVDKMTFDDVGLLERI